MILINLLDAETQDRERRRRAHNRDKSAKYRAAHPEAVKEGHRRYSEKHRERRNAEGRIRDRIRNARPERKAQLLAADRRRRQDPEVKARLNEISRRFNERNPDYRRDQVLRHCYGMSAAEYDAMLAAQGGGCDVCGAKTNKNGRRLPVDHDHDTGTVRSILCSPCNSALGYAGDSSGRLLLLAAYLQKHGK